MIIITFGCQLRIGLVDALPIKLWNINRFKGSPNGIDSSQPLPVVHSLRKTSQHTYSAWLFEEVEVPSCPRDTDRIRQKTCLLPLYFSVSIYFTFHTTTAILQLASADGPWNPTIEGYDRLHLILTASGRHSREYRRHRSPLANTLLDRRHQARMFTLNHH